MEEKGRNLFRETVRDMIVFGEIDLDGIGTSFMLTLGRFKKKGGYQYLRKNLSLEEDQELTSIFRDVLANSGIEIKDRAFLSRTLPKRVKNKKGLSPNVLFGSYEAQIRHDGVLKHDQ